jgi:hypothetical protein
MNTMKFLLLAACLSVAACATSNSGRKKILDQYTQVQAPFCKGRAPAKKFTFLLTGLTKSPVGMSGSELQTYTKGLNDGLDFLANNFIKIMLLEYMAVDARNVKTARAERSAEVEVGDHTVGFYRNLEMYQFARRAGFQLSDFKFLNLEWTKENKFFAWDLDKWGWPVSRADFDQNGIKCSSFFFNNTYNGYAGCFGKEGSLEGIFAAALANRFEAARFVNQNYFAADDSGKKELCKLAGLDETCFENVRNAETLADFSESLKGPKAIARFPFTANSKPSDAGTNGVNASLTESKFILDLALQSSVKVTKKPGKDSVDYRIDFDPSLLCKYAKPY